MPYVAAAEYRRLVASEEVCHTLLLAMGLGLMPIEEQHLRDFIAQPMLAWCDEAVATGAMRADLPEELDDV